MIDENVQNEPATSHDVELAGQLAAIDIVHGKPFDPTPHERKILADAASVGRAFGRSLQCRFAQIHPDWAYYEGSNWGNMLFEGGAFFETPPPAYENGMFKPYPPTGARTLDSRPACSGRGDPFPGARPGGGRGAGTNPRVSGARAPTSQAPAKLAP